MPTTQRASRKRPAVLTNKKQYIGQYEGPETNLNYLQARYYDGSKGEFLSEDPVS